MLIPFLTPLATDKRNDAGLKAYTPRLAVVSSLLVCLVALSVTTSASAMLPTPAWSIHADTQPTYLSAGGDGHIMLLVTNQGGAASSDAIPYTITDTVPAGLTITEADGSAAPEKLAHPVCTFTTSTVSCSGESAFAGQNGGGVSVEIGVRVRADASGMETNVAGVSGGGAARIEVSDPVMVSSQEPAYDFSDFYSGALQPDGTPDNQAGGHPNAFTTGFLFNSIHNPTQPEGNSVIAVQQPKDIGVDLPPGLVGDPQATPTCSQALVVAFQICPASTVVGTVAFTSGLNRWELSGSSQESLSGEARISPLWNVAPEHGYVAEFAFQAASVGINLYAKLVHTGAGYVVRVTAPAIPRIRAPKGVQVTFFGDPVTRDGGLTAPTAFVTNPADCEAGPSAVSIFSDSWENPGRTNSDGAPDLVEEPAWKTRDANLPPVTGCEKLQFDPEIEARPTTQRSASPSGFSVDLKIPQDSDPTGLATPELRDATVTLPNGMAISPSSANGLQACSDEQFAQGSTEPSTCPEASIVGSVKVHSPLLAEELEGHVFVGAPECDPCSNADARDGRMVRLLIEVANAARGVDVKIPGKVSLDPATGQLSARFMEAPQLPFDDLRFAFKQGERAPLSTPSTCGTYASAVDLSPWSAPYTPDAVLNPSFNVSEGCAARGFAPPFSAGTVNDQAGAFSPFTLTFARDDDEQYLDALEGTLPPGLLAKLAGVPLCGNAEASAGNCPASSRIGSVTAGAGPGADPYYATGSIYLTGPYNGGPFGEVVEVPAVAGPFNLGTVVVRGAIRVNPTTAQATVVSDPLPSILDGIPLQVRTVNVTLDRPDFTFNATSCAQMVLTGKLLSTQGTATAVSSPYEAASCASLPFKPVFSASTAARASKAGGASLDVKVASKGGPGMAGEEANIRSVKVDLPVKLPSRLTTLQRACVAKVFEADPAECPKESDVGTASASTPLLAQPLAGPAYLVSHGGEAFPSLEVVLQDEGVTLVLGGQTKIKKGVTSSTFRTVPDAPISSFELKLPTGRFSVLGANLPAGVGYDLCGQTLAMPTAITAQNGVVLKQTTKIAVIGCPKTKKTKQAEGKRTKKAAKFNREGK